jgi:hypothetical protein
MAKWVYHSWKWVSGVRIDWHGWGAASRLGRSDFAVRAMSAPQCRQVRAVASSGTGAPMTLQLGQITNLRPLPFVTLTAARNVDTASDFGCFMQ